MLIENLLVSYREHLKERRPGDIELLVIHCTELPTLSDAKKAAEMKIDGKVGCCGHFYIDRDGKIYRFVEEGRVARHVYLHNERSIGIELVNLGRFPDWFSTDHQDPCDIYPERQIKALFDLMEFLKYQFPSLRQLARHSDLDMRLVAATDNPVLKVRRRIDPGPLFPWKRALSVWATILQEGQSAC